MPLVRLIYVSARQDRGVADLQDILRLSEANNAAQRITGALIVTDHDFAQVLEGSRHEVSRCMGRIMRDRRHGRVQIASVAEMPARWFPSWSMVAFVGSGIPESLLDKGPGEGSPPLGRQTQASLERMFQRLAETMQGQAQ